MAEFLLPKQTARVRFPSPAPSPGSRFSGACSVCAHFRPPYGAHNDRTDRITGGLGYTRNVLWWGSLGDAAMLPSQQILALAKQWFLPERLVIGHANHPGITHLYPQLIELIRQRNLQTVTLRDVYGDGLLNPDGSQATPSATVTSAATSSPSLGPINAPPGRS